MLAIDYRPDEFDEYWGNDSKIKSLQRKLDKEETNVFFITGISGVGKTTLGRLIGNHLKVCEEELIEIDATNYGGIDTVRQLRKEVRLPPMFGDQRLYLLDECHMMSPQAQEGMLKTLEECPEHTFFVLCTTNPEKLKTTLKRRCFHIELEPMEQPDIVEYIEYIAEEEKTELPGKVVKQIARDCLGSPGLALAVLETIIDLDEDEMEEASTKIIEQKNETIKLIRHLTDKKKRSWKGVAAVLKNMDKSNPEKIRRDIIGYVSAVLLNKEDTRLFIVLDSFVDNVYDAGWPGIVHRCYMIYMGNK